MFDKIVEFKNSNKSMRVKFNTTHDLAKTLISLGLENQFYLAKDKDQYPGEMTFKIGSYSIDEYPEIEGTERIAEINELHDGNYLIYEI